MDVTMQMKELISKLNAASALYYTTGESTMSDAQWDSMFNELTALEKNSRIVLPDSPSVRVGAQPLTSFESHQHINRLWSLDKVQSKEALFSWMERTEKMRDELNDGRDIQFPPIQYCVEYKLDGLTINLTYRDGHLVEAATRGNGVVGEAILPQARTIRTVPLSIPYKGLLEVQGECIMRLSELEKYNLSADEPLKNARNAAAGALRNLDPSVTASRHLDAFFYQIGTIETDEFINTEEMLAFLKKNGFPVVSFDRKAKTAEEVSLLVDEIEKQRSSLDFLIDGAVVKVADKATRAAMGNTEKFPRWAIAYKFKAEEDTSTLLKVTWELGRTGKLSPVGYITPCDIGGVQVKKATLNNFGDIQRKKLAIGCEVWIRRSNDVIPEITGRIGEASPDELPIKKPEYCPSCGQKLTEKGANLYCLNRESCKPQAIARLDHFASRNAMDIDTFSEKTAELLYDKLNVRDCADLYRISVQDLLTLEGFQQKRAENLVSAIHNSKSCPLDAFIFAIGIPNVGRKTAKDLAHHFRSMEKFSAASVEALTEIPEIGLTVAQGIVDFFSFNENRDMIARLYEAGVSPVFESEAVSAILQGKTAVVTGTLQTLSREEAENLISLHGGKAASSVSKKTSFVVAGEKAGSKLTKAQSLGIPVFSEEQFLSMLGEEAEKPSL